MTRQTGAQVAADWLAAAGVRIVFSLSGNQILPLYDALDHAGIRIVHTRHESGAVHMADAYARLTGQVGVCLVTAGPGHANALGALAMAEAAESSVLLLSGHAPLDRAGQGAFQEMEQVALAQPLTRWSAVARRADDIPALLRHAFHAAQADRPGPVHLSLPVNVLTATVSADSGVAYQPSSITSAAVARGRVNARAGGDQAQGAGPRVPRSGDAASSDDGPSLGPTPEIDAIVSALRTAQLPLILAGPSASRPAVHGLLTHFAARTGIPLLILDHPRGLSDPALGQAGKALARADAVLLFGKRQDYRLAYAQSPAIPDGVRLFQIDPEPGEIGRHRLVEIGAAASPLTAAQQLVAAAEAHAWPAVSTPWTEELEALRAARLYERVPRGAGGPLHPLHVFDALVDLLDRLGEEHVTVAIDGGEFGQWARARLRLRPPEHLVNEPSGAIGFAVPFAIGAKAAFPDRTAIAICGDGAFGFTAMELETAARCGLPVLVVVGTDGAWGTERHLQVERYGCTVATDLTTARYDLLAAGLGGHGEHVTQLDQLGPALSRALAAVERGQPALVNVSLLSIPSPAALPG